SGFIPAFAGTPLQLQHIRAARDSSRRTPTRLLNAHHALVPRRRLRPTRNQRTPTMDPTRRNILATGVAAAATATAPRVFAQQPLPPGDFKFYERGNVRIRYQEAGTGFPL